MTSSERLFPKDHPLYRLVRPHFDGIRQALKGLYVSAIWVDSAQDPSREGYRPSYDKVYGAGSASMMPLIASWMSTGASKSGVSPTQDNSQSIAVLPDDIDRTAVAHMQSLGLLGEYVYIKNIAELKTIVKNSGRKVYAIDDFGEDFDDHVVIRSKLSQWVNSKGDLPSITAHAPKERIVDMFSATVSDFADMYSPGHRVFLKTCNTESAGAGVHIVANEQEYQQTLAKLQAHQQKYNLNRTLVIQPEIVGRNCSFQVFLNPAVRDEINVVAITDQLVEADGKTYRASLNHPITADRLARIGPAIVDMVDRIWARHPEAFGFVMCDYFDTEQGVVLYDPGIRPTGNTATAMAFHLARKITGKNLFASLLQLPTKQPGLNFERFAQQVGELVNIEHLAKHNTWVVPWGWNPIQGFGMLIGIAPDIDTFEAIRKDLLSRKYQ